MCILIASRKGLCFTRRCTFSIYKNLSPVVRKHKSDLWHQGHIHHTLTLVLPLRACSTRSRPTLRISQIPQPSPRVKLCNNILNLPFLGPGTKTTTLTFDSRYYRSHTNALNRKWRLSRQPTDNYCIASIPQVQDFKGDIGLSALSSEKLCFGGKGQFSELGVGKRWC